MGVQSLSIFISRTWKLGSIDGASAWYGAMDNDQTKRSMAEQG